MREVTSSTNRRVTSYMIDLRSDTVTVPDEAMRAAMAVARVGDDVYAEDPTVNALQERVAAMFGMEAALFVPSGTQGNQICLALHAKTGEEVIAEADAHILHYENAATSVIARAQIHAVPSFTGAMPLEAVEQAIRPDAYYYPRTAVIAVENSHNRHGGTVLDLDYLHDLRELATSRGLGLHCDGARIWNAMAATTTPPEQYGAIFDTMSVCLSKGLGAPVGSLVLSTRSRIDQAWRWRKMLGGGMRQTGMLAAAGLYALDHVLPLLADDHRRARAFAEAIAGHPLVHVNLDRVQTNIVMFRVNADTEEFVTLLHQEGIRIAQIRPGVLRAVFHHQITDHYTTAAAEAVHHILSLHHGNS